MCNYAFPIMMALSSLRWFSHHLALVAAALTVAAVSWHCVGRPASDRRRRRRSATRAADSPGGDGAPVHRRRGRADV